MPVGPKMIVVAKSLAQGLPMIQLLCHIAPILSHNTSVLHDNDEVSILPEHVIVIVLYRLLDILVHLMAVYPMRQSDVRTTMS